MIKKTWKMSLATLGLALMPALAQPADANIQLVQLGSYSSGIFDASAAEISAYDPISKRLFVVNAQSNQVDILDLSNPANPTKIGVIDGSPYGGGINSVAVSNGVIAFASQAVNKTNPGTVGFADANGNVYHTVAVGALPDMLTFTPDGNKIVVANEGEVNETNDGVNPAGSVSIIDLSSGVTSATVSTADFTGFNHLAPTSGDSTKSQVRISPFAQSAAQDIEPEYIAVSSDSTKAYVTLQDNNAIAVVDLATSTVTHVLPLGVKDHSKADSGFISYDGVNNSSNALDASNQDGGINIKNWDNVYGIYMPDALAIYEVNGRIFAVTANEGDSRADFDGYNDESRLRAATTNAFFAGTRDNDQAGRLNISTIDGVDEFGNRTEAYAFGSRSFSIWDVTDPSTWMYDPITGNMTGLVYDSGDDFEQITAALFPASFNTSNNGNEFDNRSDDKGPEPEGVTVAQIDGRWYAFIALERIGGVMVYDVTDPLKPIYIDYINPRNFDPALTGLAIGDLGPEGLLFIDAADSPVSNALLVVTNEVSGTTTIYEIQSLNANTPVVPEPTTATLGLLGLGAMGLATARRRR